MRNSRPAVALIAAAALGIAACGDDDDKAATPKTVAITATEAGKRAKLSIPETVPAGVVTVTLKNDGKLPHEASLIRIDDGHTTAEAVKSIDDDTEGAPIPAWIHGAGGTGAVPPGETLTSTQRLEPGSYVAFDSAARDQELDLESGYATFTVEGDDAGGELPKTSASIEAFDYGFKTSGLKTGKNTIEFRNTGKELHHVVAAAMRPGGTLAKVKAELAKENGEPPLDFESVRATAILDGGVKQVTELEFAKPGSYVLLCFIQDRKGGPPHIAKGMVAEVEVP